MRSFWQIVNTLNPNDSCSQRCHIGLAEINPEKLPENLTSRIDLLCEQWIVFRLSRSSFMPVKAMMFYNNAHIEQVTFHFKNFIFSWNNDSFIRENCQGLWLFSCHWLIQKMMIFNCKIKYTELSRTKEIETQLYLQTTWECADSKSRTLAVRKGFWSVWNICLTLE